MRSLSKILLAGALALAACAAPQQSVRLDAVAQQLPLRGPDGPSSVAALGAGHRALVLVFWAAGCPCVRRYQARVDALVSRWSAHDVRVIGISANADETLRDVEVARRERGVTLPVWRDSGGQLARAVGARSTPMVVVLLPDGQVVYRGWLDNERNPGEPTREAWLDAALTRVVSGDLRPEERPRWGCLITGGEPADRADSASDCGCKVRPAGPEAGK